MTTRTRTRQIAPLATRREAVAVTQARLTELVYRTMRLEGESVSRTVVAAAVERALGR